MKFSIRLKLFVVSMMMLGVSAGPMSLAAHASGWSPLKSFSAAVECPAYRTAQGRSTIQIIPAWDKYLDCDNARDGAITNFDFPSDLWLVALAGIEILLRLALYLAIGFVIYGAFYMIISQGNPEKIQLGRQIIEQALTGFVIAMLSTGIVLLVERSIT